MKVIILTISCLLLSSAKARVADRGLEEEHPSEAIPTIFHLDTDVFHEQFVRVFSSAEDNEREDFFRMASARELHQFMENNDEKLTQYHEQASKAFGDRYGNRVFVVISNKTDSAVKVYGSEIVFDSAQAFMDYAIVDKANIKKLRLDFDLLGADLEDTLKFVQENLADTLKSLELRGIFGSDFEQLQDISFAQVEELSFYSSYLYYTDFDLTETFPAVTRLSATFTEFGQRDWVQKYFPKITELQVDIDKNVYFKETDVLDILRRNKNIKSLSVVSCPQSLLTKINNNHNQVKNLGIISMPYQVVANQVAVVKMKHVERFLYEDLIDYNYTEFIKFENLKELQWHSAENPEYLLMKILKRHAKQIDTLEIEDADLTDDHLGRMHNLKKLKRVSFGFDPDMTETSMSIDGLIAFVKANKNIAEVRLNRAKQEFYDAAMNAFEELGFLFELGDAQSFNDANFVFTKPGQTVQWVDTLRFLRNNFN